ncbi:MAG: glycosyltransferase, partial [Eubacterium sp.]|nr:glycosyltransferase [Eubacterium sp.]
MKKVADISVIVPIYNVEEYLAECLDSIVCQTKQDFEVIMVDDGSTDSSGEIAKSYAEKYPNFHYLYKENNGLGCARNYGVAHSDSKYIIFMDSDDKISEDLYEKMFNAAEKNNSDLTICNVVRCNSKKSWSSSLHKIAFADIDANTHIAKNTNLFYDTTSWNKLI